MATEKEMQDKLATLLLAENFKALNIKFDEHVEQYKLEYKETQRILKDISDQLNTFTSAIRAGKWASVSILLILGALGHKSAAYLAQFFTGS